MCIEKSSKELFNKIFLNFSKFYIYVRFIKVEAFNKFMKILHLMMVGSYILFLCIQYHPLLMKTVFLRINKPFITLVLFFGSFLYYTGRVTFFIFLLFIRKDILKFKLTLLKVFFYCIPLLYLLHYYLR